MDTSLFARLPRELRDEIWELAIQTPDSCRMFKRKRRFKIYTGYDDDSRRSRNNCPCRKDCPWTDWRHEKIIAFAITMTCKQIRREASPLVYSAIRFEAPIHFTPFGLKFGHKQARVYAHGLSLSRKWLKTIGMLNSQAISRFELDLGTWMLDGVDMNGTYKRGWWFGARNMERKQLMPMLRQSALYIRVGVAFSNSFYNEREKRWDYFVWSANNRPERVCQYPRLLKEQCYRIKFVISGADMVKQRQEIEQAFQTNLSRMEQHASHSFCEVGRRILELRREHKRARDVMLNAVGIRVDEDDASLGLDDMHL